MRPLVLLACVSCAAGLSPVPSASSVSRLRWPLSHGARPAGLRVSAATVAAVALPGDDGDASAASAATSAAEALAPATPPSEKSKASPMMTWLTSGEMPRLTDTAAEEGTGAKAEKAAALDPEAALSRMDAFEVAGWERSCGADLVSQASRQRSPVHLRG